jgi:nitrite reductase/ring-hydroxylating ferredoxin subunit
MELIQRILRIPRTKRPRDERCWAYSRGMIVIEWGRVPELQKPCGAIRLEERGLADRILVVYGIDGQFHAFRNRCPHRGGRLDPVPGRAAVRSCGLSRSTFDYAGNIMSGPAKDALKTYKVKTNKCRVIIRLD